MRVYVVNSAFHKGIKAFSTKEKAIKFVENFTKSSPTNMEYKYTGNYTDLTLLEYTYISPVSGEKDIAYFYIGEAEIDADAE